VAPIRMNNLSTTYDIFRRHLRHGLYKYQLNQRRKLGGKMSVPTGILSA